MDKILTFSDLHIDGKSPATIERFKQTLAHALSRHGDAEAIVLCGDLSADTGKEADYTALSDVLTRVALPVLPMMGNHDKRSKFLSVFRDAPKTKQGHIQQVFDIHQHRLITLDTLEPGAVEGRLCPDRMAWLMKQLDDAGDRHKVVFAHHPPMKVGAPAFDAIRLRDGPELLELLAGYDNVTVVSGHIHRAASGMSRGVPWITLPAVAGASAMPPAPAEPGDLPGYGVLMLQKHGLALHPIFLA